MTEFRELGKREILQKYLPDQVNYSYENSTAWKTESIEGRVVYVDETLRSLIGELLYSIETTFDAAPDSDPTKQTKIQALMATYSQSSAKPLIKKEQINHKELFYPKETTEYIYTRGWNHKGLFSIVIGFIFSASTIWNVNLTSLQSFAWIIGAFVSFLLYYLISNE